ncbi:hypothetical protein, partial [Dietzia kunjamensis]|uniref:hypothetical protein n=1 Tax=Dietzia kunjamensis TaxID=322509 RepID=UPI0019D6402A
GGHPGDGDDDDEVGPIRVMCASRSADRHFLTRSSGRLITAAHMPSPGEILDLTTPEVRRDVLGTLTVLRDSLRTTNFQGSR